MHSSSVINIPEGGEEDLVAGIPNTAMKLIRENYTVKTEATGAPFPPPPDPNSQGHTLKAYGREDFPPVIDHSIYEDDSMAGAGGSNIEPWIPVSSTAPGQILATEEERDKLEELTQTLATLKFAHDNYQNNPDITGQALMHLAASVVDKPEFTPGGILPPALRQLAPEDRSDTSWDVVTGPGPGTPQPP